MKRKEARFARIPKFAARVYDSGARLPAIGEYYATIAREAAGQIDQGRLLDVGTGPGRLLLEIWKLNPDIELFGLDISKAMLEVAADNLIGIPVRLIRANVSRTGLPEDYFDVVTCSGSFYLLEKPVESLAEIHRILRKGSVARLYESHCEFDAQELRRGLQENLKDAGPLFRFFAPRALRKQLSMTYPIDELRRLIDESPFGASFLIEKITISRLPVWLRITLKKI